MTDTKETKPKKVTVGKVAKTVKPTKKVTEKISSDIFAIIQIAGVQLKVQEGKEYEVNKLEGKKGDKIEVKEVLLVSDGKETMIGKPYVDGKVVMLEITSQTRGEKIEGFKYAAKARYRRNYGYRSSITKVIVKSI